MARGARVVVVSANVALPDPAGVEMVRVTSAQELCDAVTARAPEVDIVVMAAAVADFRPAAPAAHKIKKHHEGGALAAPTIALEPTTDVLAELVRARRPGQLVVGFAAETGDEHGSVLDHARAKLARKAVDLLVVNDVSDGKVFGEDHNAVTIVGLDGLETAVPSSSKDVIADAIWDRVVRAESAQATG